ncbi:MAG: NUDIX domain-containing protein [Deltaproteobacteria bacterium]|nr:NUDIX domain-containing protein [Deltaproteobacteria bacterium]
MADSIPIPVITAFLTRCGEVLLLKRSQRVGTYQGRWSGVSGHLESGDALAQAWIELGEELGVGPAQAVLETRGEPVLVRDEASGRSYLVHPFRFALSQDARPRLDWENVEMRWLPPSEIPSLPTVPGLVEVWERVAF